MIEVRLTPEETRKLITYGYVDTGNIRIIMGDKTRDLAHRLLVSKVDKP